MSPAFLRALELVLRHEGGLVDDPRDPGGLTQFGISQRAYPNVDIRALTKLKAGEIYHADYWLPIRGDELPEAVAIVLFDMAVNMGRDRAVRLLQRALNIPQDGLLGPRTIAACINGSRRAVALNLTAERVIAYTGMRGFDTYGRGWLRRSITTALEANA